MTRKQLIDLIQYYKSTGFKGRYLNFSTEDQKLANWLYVQGLCSEPIEAGELKWCIAIDTDRFKGVRIKPQTSGLHLISSSPTPCKTTEDFWQHYQEGEMSDY
jgi:hypothetical protein